MRWFWGLLILCLGVILLGLNLNFYDAVSISDVVQFWPLMLILFGISLICKNLKFGWIIILISFIFSMLFIHYFLLNQSIYSIGGYNFWDSIKNWKR